MARPIEQTTATRNRRARAAARRRAGEAKSETPVEAADTPPRAPVEAADAQPEATLDAALELTAFRIVQEALTNVLKHAAGARASVVLRYAPDALDLTVTDEGGQGRHALAGTDRGGRGLVGMRERVAVYDGTLETGPTPTGFRVHAHLPLASATAATTSGVPA